MQYVQYSMITRSINLEDSAKNNYALSKPYRSRKKTQRKSPFINRVSAFNDDNYEDGTHRTRATQIF